MENYELEQSLKHLRRELRMTRIFCVVSSLLTAGLLLGGVLVYKQIKPVIEMIQNVQPVMEQLSALDVDAINSTIEGLDIDGISEAIENLNNAADVLEGLGEKFNSLGNLFGR